MKTNTKSSNIHFSLGDNFFDKATPAIFPNHVLRFRNNRAASRLNLDKLNDEDWISCFGKFIRYPGVEHGPLALKYHGHQFGHYNSELGDGRGFLLSQFLDKSNDLWDLGTKGSGKTNFSRGGDGRLTLKGAVRELLATELLSSLGVSTSQTLSIIETEENLHRNDEPSPTRSAVLVRRSKSHIRIGTFQRLSYLNEDNNIEKLTRHVIQNYFPSLNNSENINILVENFFLESVKRIATMTGRITAAGFVHGVLNTDNFNVTGECFDYGPWRFVEFAEPNFTAAYFDYNKRYSFGRQPEAALWALTQLGNSLSSFLNEKKINQILNEFSNFFNNSLSAHFCWRLGIKDVGAKNINKIIQILLKISVEYKIDFSSFFYNFYGGSQSISDCLNSFHGAKYKNEAFFEIISFLKKTDAEEGCLAKRVFFKDQPENLLIEEVERIWDQIDKNDNWTFLEDKIDRIRAMGDLLGAKKLVNF
ncbi:YdiU family protein [Pseudomonadota bacterium]|nr:YdiU family protein [Pseudomonadota bacterium]